MGGADVKGWVLTLQQAAVDRPGYVTLGSSALGIVGAQSGL